MISTAESINDKVLRLHILANSDTDYDQQLKLKVRDYIIEKTGYIFSNSDSLEDAIYNVKLHLDDINNFAQQTIYDNGYDYSVKTYIDKEYFETRKYDDFYMPAGEYNSLKIVIGEGRGHNWWCVMYPNMCFHGAVYEAPDKEAGESLQRVLSEDEYDAVLKSRKYRVRFKFIEKWNQIFHKK